MSIYFNTKDQEQNLGLWLARGDIEARNKLIGDEQSGVIAVIRNMCHLCGLTYSSTKKHLVPDMQNEIMLYLLEKIDRFDMTTTCNSCGKSVEYVKPCCPKCRSLDVTYRGLRGTLFSWVSGLSRLKLLDRLKHEKRYEIFPEEVSPREKWRQRIKDRYGTHEVFDSHDTNSMHEAMKAHHERFDMVSEAKAVLNAIDRITSGEVSLQRYKAAHIPYSKIIARVAKVKQKAVVRWIRIFNSTAEA